MKVLNTINEKNNYNMVDVFKFFLAYIVVAYHTNPFVDASDSVSATILQFFADLTVPFYLVVSGYLLYTSINKNKTKSKEKINNYLKKILKMYCMTTLISLPVIIYGYIVSGNSLFNCILSFVKYFFFVGKLYNSYHLWYLLALIYAVIMIKYMVIKNVKEENMVVVGLIVYTVFVVMWYLEKNIHLLDSRLTKIVHIYEFVFNTGVIFSGIVYVSIGFLIAKHKKYLSPFVCVILIIIINILKRYIGEIPTEYIRLPETVLLFMLMVGIILPESKIYAYIRRLGVNIYLYHLIIISIYTIIIIKQPNKYGVDTFVFTAITSTIFGMVCIRLTDKINATKQFN